MVIQVQDGMPEPASPEVALAVDLDGTLILTDTLHEGLVKLLKARPFDALRMPAWLGAGKRSPLRRLSRQTRLRFGRRD